MSIQKNEKLLEYARDLRREMTGQERHLWYDFLRYYPVKWYKQKIIGNFIVDFYCHAAKLVIEIDGSQHYTDSGIDYDKARTEKLKQCGVKVLRFSNLDVDKNFAGVCMMIEKTIKTRMETMPSQSR